MTPVGLLLAFALPVPALQDTAPTPLLPAEAVWVMRYDDQPDGDVKAKAGGGVRWALSVRNDRITGRLAGAKAADPANHQLAGEVVAGTPPLVSVRQDGPRGLVCYYVGRRVAADRIVGTWYDNRGGAGDFEWTPERGAVP